MRSVVIGQANPCGPKAAIVLPITTTLIMGPAIIYVTQVPSGNPLRISRRNQEPEHCRQR